MNTESNLVKKLLVFRSLSYSYDNDCVFQGQIEKDEFLKILMQHAQEYVFEVYDELNNMGCQSLKAWQCIAHALMDVHSIYGYRNAVDCAGQAQMEIENETTG